jgi:hypothetical protein
MRQLDTFERIQMKLNETNRQRLEDELFSKPFTGPNRITQIKVHTARALQNISRERIALQPDGFHRQMIQAVRVIDQKRKDSAINNVRESDSRGFLE